MRILIYGDARGALSSVVAKLRSVGHIAAWRNPKWFRPSETELCDAVVFERDAVGLQAAYAEAGIPTYAATEAIQALADGKQSTTPEQQDLVQNHDTETAEESEPRDPAHALWGRARAQGMTKAALTDAIAERGAEAVAAELGVTWEE